MYHCFPKIKKHISTSKRHLHVCTVKKPGLTVPGRQAPRGWSFCTPCTAVLSRLCLCISKLTAANIGYGVAMEASYQATGSKAV